MEARKQVYNDLTSSFNVKHIGDVYPDDEHATDCIDNDRTFFALNEFAPVKSRFVTIQLLQLGHWGLPLKG